jgi:hypothetical protein
VLKSPVYLSNGYTLVNVIQAFSPLPLTLPADHKFALARPALRTKLSFLIIIFISEIVNKMAARPI